MFFAHLLAFSFSQELGINKKVFYRSMVDYSMMVHAYIRLATTDGHTTHVINTLHTYHAYTTYIYFLLHPNLLGNTSFAHFFKYPKQKQSQLYSILDALENVYVSIISYAFYSFQICIYGSILAVTGVTHYSCLLCFHVKHINCLINGCSGRVV